jgi:hypothetical protein
LNAIKRTAARADNPCVPGRKGGTVPHWLGFLIVVMVVVDVAVVLLILRRRGRPALGQAAVDFARIHQLTRASEERMVGYLEANYSRRPDQLPQALQGALDIARQTAREQLVPLDEDGLRLVVTTIVCARKIASRAEVAKALATLPAAGQTAA